MDPQEPTNGRRTGILSLIGPWLVAGAVLLGFPAVLVTIRSHGNNVTASSASLSSCPPTATAGPVTPPPARLGPPPSSGTPTIDEGAGIPTIKPTNSTANAKAAGCNASTTLYRHPGTPAITLAQAEAAAVKHDPFGFHSVVQGSKLTVLSATFMSASAAEAKLNIALMLPADEVVCVVEVGGRFEDNLVMPSPSGTPTKTRMYDAIYIIYDGHTGNLLATWTLQPKK
jgi:hypothetical protein